MSVTVSIFGLAFLILIHEAGHFFTARAVGMRPRRFYVGFPPALAKTTRNGIEYGLGAIPLGGYVKIPGMHRPAPSDLEVYFGGAVQEAPQLLGPVARVKRPLVEGDMDNARASLRELAAAVETVQLSSGATRAAERGLRELDDGLGADAYWRQRTWRRLAVVSAGPGTNLAFAIALLAVVYMIGIPFDASRRVATVTAKSPAAAIGLRSGDVIVGINRHPTDTFKELSKRIRGSHGQPLVVSVIRNGKYLELGPKRPQKIDGYYALGFRPSGIRYKRYGAGQALKFAAEDTWTWTKRIVSFLGHITKRSNREQISTPVGIVSQSSKAVQSGYRDYLAVLALISLSLTLLNLLPLLPLDGGHIAFSIIEGIRGRAVGRAVYERVSAVGIALVLLLYIVGISNDIGRLNGG